VSFGPPWIQLQETQTLKSCFEINIRTGRVDLIDESQNLAKNFKEPGMYFLEILLAL
jgi:hypothetical protein